MDSRPFEELVDRIHASGWMGVVAVTGGGAGAITELLHRGGGSATLLEAVVPYSEEALVRFLHAKPEAACDETTARRMAMAAYRRACELRPGPGGFGQRFGVGLTAALAKAGERAGREHRLFAAWQTADRTEARSVTLAPAARMQEEAAAAAVALEAVGRACGIDAMLPAPGATLRDTRRGCAAPPEWRQVVHTPGRWWRTEPGEPAPLLLCGSFNPAHAGHVAMGQAAARIAGGAVDFELSAANPDKPPLDYLEISDRLAGIAAAGYPAVLTNAPLFVEKARALPGRTFIVGADTWERLVDPRYYGGTDGLRRTLDIFAECGSGFLVFGRCVGGCFHGPATLPMPEHPFVRDRVRCIAENEFRMDVSSTEIRARMRGRESGERGA